MKNKNEVGNVASALYKENELKGCISHLKLYFKKTNMFTPIFTPQRKKKRQDITDYVKPITSLAFQASTYDKLHQLMF